VQRFMKVFNNLSLACAVLCLIAVCSLDKLWVNAQERVPGVNETKVYVAEVDSLIHPVSAEFINQTVKKADANDVDLIVFVLRTPGGLVDATRAINTSIIESDTPVVVYVGPSGARAASAGFLITIAADVAAMAPGTHIGAAHPVSGTGESMDETMAEKAASDVAAYARSLASQRNRNVQLAEKAVVESQSFTEQEALQAEPPLIDFVAEDVDHLLQLLDGYEVTRWDGETVVLDIGRLEVEQIEMTWRQRLLSAIAHPQIAVLLLSLGTLGLTIELWNPGGIIPGIAGAVCLLLAFFAFQVLPINYVGLLLILLGIGLLVAEMMTATYGLLATGGIVSMVLGSLMLVDSPLPELQLGWFFVISLMLPLGLIVLGLTRLGLRAQLATPVTGRSGMVGQTGLVTKSISAGSSGLVSTHGELWSAMADVDINVGEEIRVVSVTGLKLIVKRK